MEIQVGLLGLARTLQQDLDRIAEDADTTTTKGLHNILTGNVVYTTCSSYQYAYLSGLD